MPWSQTSLMDQRMQFIADYLRHCLSFTELCERYGVARKTGYKLVDPYLRLGPRDSKSDRLNRAIRPTKPSVLGDRFVRPVVTPAVHNGPEACTELLLLQLPRPMVAGGAVDKDKRLATPAFDAFERCAVDSHACRGPIIETIERPKTSIVNSLTNCTNLGKAGQPPSCGAPTMRS
jgi:hypothetical protein